MPAAGDHRVRRRLVTIPAICMGLVVVSATLPALVLVALLVDLLRPAGRRSLASVRLALFLWAFLAIEVVGLGMLAGAGLVTLGSRERRAALTWRIQRLFTGALMIAVRRLFSLGLEVEGSEVAAERGPVLVFMRHASIIDVLLPGVLIANRYKVRLRYVLKRELLVDPCLDVAGHWIDNCFVTRDGADSEREVETVRALAAGMGPDDGVLIYPEGTRFTEGKRRRALERLAADPVTLARAERLKHLLPFRPGGPLALLDAGCDVLFVAHRGLEGFASIRDIWAGRLVGTTLRVKMWRVRAATIPADREARLAWMWEHWQRLDDWLDVGDERSTMSGAFQAG